MLVSAVEFHQHITRDVTNHHVIQGIKALEEPTMT